MALNIDLWLWSLDLPKPATSALRAHLSAAEITRADRFVRQNLTDRYTAGRGRLREILGTYTEHPPHALAFETSLRGKPLLPDGPSFNLSHTKGWAALAVAPNHTDLALGIDIEAHREIEFDLPKRFFSPVEQSALAALPKHHWTRGFFQAWTRKEAVIKATGEGLHTELSSFDVSLGQAPGVLRTSPPMPAPDQWTLTNLALGPNISGALAAITGGEALEIRVRQGSLLLPNA